MSKNNTHRYAPPPGPPPGFVAQPVYLPPPGPPPGWVEKPPAKTKPGADESDDLPPAYSVLPFDDIDFKADAVEPMLLLDTTGSMQSKASPDHSITRLDLVKQSIGLIVKELAEFDSQAVDEQGSDEEGGGLRTVTFSGGNAFDIGDLNSENLHQKFSKIVWEGSTQIVPGFSKLVEVYEDEFGDFAPTLRPKMISLIITDGEALDINDLAVMILTMDFAHIYLVFALIGYGPDYENAFRSLKELSQLNDHIRVIEMNMATNPLDIAKVCLSMIR
ncbi:hypothetical protein HK100_007748 [Physocladia obscura]|uniref:VWFA domain-containing protein n=1 Tax=Physocladia obscura TaxID=109957 RepID=A0AAD5T790_9FUNG|nr:hypothetical protein HK100_007748 [Physocladia obscura]